MGPRLVFAHHAHSAQIVAIPSAMGSPCELPRAKVGLVFRQASCMCNNRVH